jgi:glycosyltransferase involved in cell wall biosynthesis
MIAEPLVSVSCLTFNHSPYIRQCLDGILSQETNFPFEIVLYDDASTDGTEVIIREYEKNYPGIFNIWIQKDNQYSKGVRGIAPKFNFPRCRGKYIAFCEGDDYWTDTGKLQKQIDFLESNPEFMISCTNYSEVDQRGKLLKKNKWEGIKLSPVISHEMIFEYYKPKILTSVFRKSVFEKGFPDIFFRTFNTDNFLCALATQYGPAGFLNFNSGAYRVHNQGVWSGKTEIKQFEMQLSTFQNMQCFFVKDLQQKAISNRIYKIRRALSRLYARELEFGKSMNQLMYIFSKDPIDSTKAFLGNLVAPILKFF